MIHQFIESVELEKENQELKNAISKQLKELIKADEKIKDLEDTLTKRESKITDLQEELDLLYGDDFETVKYNFEGLIEYLGDNHMLTDELKNIIEFYLKFYIDV